MTSTPHDLVRLARALLFAREDAHIHLPKAKAAAYVRMAEKAFWAHAKSASGSTLSEDELAAALVLGGVPHDQATRWSRAIVRDEDDDGVELTLSEDCAHCGSGMRAFVLSCGVCGQPRGSAPRAEGSKTRAARLVRRLIASNRLALVTAHAESAVVEETAALLDDHKRDELPVVAAALEAAWMDRADVAEVFTELDEIVAALRVT